MDVFIDFNIFMTFALLLFREKMIDLLVIGTETHHINQLMKYTSSFFTRRVIHNSVSDMTGSVRKDDKHWIDGGFCLKLILQAKYSSL